jgi:hypothetical protein
MLDLFQAGWYSVAYWADMADLATQAADSPAAAETFVALLLQERHSIYFARQVMPLLGLLSDTSDVPATCTVIHLQASLHNKKFAVRCCFGCSA